MNDRRWTPIDTTSSDSFVHGVELNADGFRYCYWTGSFMVLNKEEYEKLSKAWVKI